jgi:hypothetical protein
MTQQQIGLLAIQGFASGIILAYLGTLLWKRREERERFKLYAVRDQFVYLAATGKLPQTSMVFKVFYKIVNISISEVRSLNLSSLVRASTAARTALEEERQEALMDSVARCEPEVREAVDNFVKVMMEAAYANSLGLRLFLKCARLVQIIVSALKVSPPQPAAYETYEYWREMHSRGCAA